MIWLPMSPATQTLLTFSLLPASDGDLGDFGEVAAVAEVERDAHAACPSAAASRPSRDFSRTSSSTPRMRAASKPSLSLWATAAGAGSAATSGCVEQVEPELQRILARGVRELVDERLEDERERVAARRAQRAGRHAERHHARPEREVRDEARRELRRRDVRRRCANRSPSPKVTK